MKTLVYNRVTQLFVVFFLVVGTEVKAQYPYDFSYVGIPYDSKTIVRNYDDHYVVVYYEENERGYVSLVDVIGNDARTVPLDEGVSMNDMCIMDDSVFLCGNVSLSNGTYGCVVAMKLNNFYTSSVLVSYYEPSNWLNIDLKCIEGSTYTYGVHTYKKFLFVGEISYPCDGSYSFPANMMNAGVLKNKYYTNEFDHSECTENIVLELGYPFPNGYSNNIVIRFVNTEEHSEVIHDVVETDNYVVFVGVVSGVYDSITLHICNKFPSILYTNASVISDFESYYTYSLGTTSGSPFYHACALDGDNIVIATQEEASSSSDKITIRTFDVSTHTMTHSQELQCSPSPELKDMVYILDSHKVVLLFHDYFRPTGYYSDVFCTADPYISTPSYTQPGMAEAIHNLKYGSLDAMGGTYFISTGGKHGIVSDVANYSSIAPCYNLWDYRIVEVTCMNSQNSYYHYDQYLPVPENWQTIVDTVVRAIPSVCIINR